MNKEIEKEVKKEVKKLIKKYKLDCSIEEFQDKDEVNWNRISKSQKLSESFIREFKDKVNWNRISYKQKLSENFIKEFQDKVDWKYISEYQKFSEDFYKEFKDKISIDRLKKNKNMKDNIETITKVVFKDLDKKEQIIDNRFEILDIR